MKRNVIAVLSWVALTAFTFVASAAEFRLEENDGSALTVLLGDKPVVRYMYAHDTSTRERRHDTYKPYLHVFDADGIRTITKGPGGEFTHHRGIFIGWNRIRFRGRSYDRWHMRGGDIVHQEFSEKSAGPESARFTSLTHWLDEEEKPIVEERRTVTVHPAARAGRLIIDFESELSARRGDVELGGDPEHAGVQFRPSDEVVRAETTYIFPKLNADPREDRDYPWVGSTFTLHGRRHTVVHMNHPENPDETRYSAYRDYGRFGAFFVATIPDGQSLRIRYRFLIIDGEFPGAAAVQQEWNDFAGLDRSVEDPPQLTVVNPPAPRSR